MSTKEPVLELAGACKMRLKSTQSLPAASSALAAYGGSFKIGA